MKVMGKVSGYIQKIAQNLKSGKLIADFRTGDTIRVFLSITDEGMSRVQEIEGVCIAIRHSRCATGDSFVNRRGSGIDACELNIPYCSPSLEKVVITRYGDPRRAKLYYLRTRQGKEAKVRERKVWDKKRKLSAVS